MTWTPPVKALEWDILAMEAMADMEPLGGAMEVWAWVMEVSGGVLEALEEATEDLVDMEVSVDLYLHLTVLECPLMALEEDMEELAHTATVVQVPFTGCQDSEGPGDIMLLLQPMVGSLLLMELRNLLMVLNHLHMVLSHLHMTRNLLLMELRNLHMVLSHLHMVLSHLHTGHNLLHTALNLLHMAHNLLHMAHNLELSNNLVLSSNLSSSLLLYL